jgi:hypothetical protein
MSAKKCLKFMFAAPSLVLSLVPRVEDVWRQLEEVEGRDGHRVVLRCDTWKKPAQVRESRGDYTRVDDDKVCIPVLEVLRYLWMAMLMNRPPCLRRRVPANCWVMSFP